VVSRWLRRRVCFALTEFYKPCKNWVFGRAIGLTIRRSDARSRRRQYKWAWSEVEPSLQLCEDMLEDSDDLLHVRDLDAFFHSVRTSDSRSQGYGHDAVLVVYGAIRTTADPEESRMQAYGGHRVLVHRPHTALKGLTPYEALRVKLLS
jgi:hypothetical protein